MGETKPDPTSETTRISRLDNDAWQGLGLKSNIESRPNACHNIGDICFEIVRQRASDKISIHGDTPDAWYFAPFLTRSKPFRS